MQMLQVKSLKFLWQCNWDPVNSLQNAELKTRNSKNEVNLFGEIKNNKTVESKLAGVLPGTTLSNAVRFVFICVTFHCRFQPCSPSQPPLSSSFASPPSSPVGSGTPASVSWPPSFRDTTWWGRASTWSPCSGGEPTWLTLRPAWTRLALAPCAPTLCKATSCRRWLLL